MDAPTTASHFKIRSRVEIASAARRLTELAARLGPFGVFATADISSPEPMRDARGVSLNEQYFTWMSDERVKARHGDELGCPIAQAMRYESRPFIYRQQRFITLGPNRYIEQLERQTRNSKRDYEVAIVIPVRMPFGVIGGVAFVTDDPSVDAESILEENLAELSIAAHNFVTSYADVAHGERGPQDLCKLTPSEVQCIRWVASGKTDEEIAVILGRSTATVRFHLRNAAMKFNTVNRAHTIFRAAQLGYMPAA